MATANDVVLAGTKAFALALFAPLTERSGTRPRIAPEPQQALTLCSASSGVLVVEYGEAWLPVLRQLRLRAAGLRIVAALPRGLEAAALVLGPLGIEAVPWDGQPGPVLSAVEGPSGGAPAPGPVPRPAVQSPAPPVPPAAVPSPSAAPAGDEPLDLFADLGGTAATPVPGQLGAVDPFVHSAGAAASHYVPPPRPPRDAAWPATVPSPAEAEQALAAALTGTLAAESPLRTLADQAVAAMSDLERGVLTGAGIEVASAPLRGAAVMRLRISTAISTRPPPGGQVDAAAVEAMLGEIDALLAAVNGLLGVASEALKPALEVVRNSLVKEAVDFSEAAHRPSEAAALPPRADPRPAPGRDGATARVLSVQAGQDEQAEVETRRGRRLWVVFALVVLAAGAFHGYRWMAKERLIAALPTLPGAPDRMMLLRGAPGSPKVLLPLQGPPDRTQVERFKAQQQQLGYTVTELEGGGLSVTPGRDGTPTQEKRTP